MTVTTPEPTKALTVHQQKALTIRNAIESREVQLMDVMPDGLDLKRFIRTTLIAVSQNDALLECTPESLVTAIFEAAECGIQPTGSLGRGYLVPIRNTRKGVVEAEFWIGYPGLIELAMRSDKVSKVWSRAVFAGDHFEVQYGTLDRIVHIPTLGADVIAANLTHVYACVAYKDGAVDFEPLTKEQVDLVRARARGANSASSPWQTDYIEQARKTAIRKLAKRMPLTPEAGRAIQKDEEREFGFEERRQEAEAKEKRATSLKDRIRGGGKAEEPPLPEAAPAKAETVKVPPDYIDDEDLTPEEMAAYKAAMKEETLEGQFTEACGEQSDPALGTVETCIKPLGHDSIEHQSAEGAIWTSGKPRKAAE